MIKPRKHIEEFERDGQPYDTRLNRMRLAFNEYVDKIDDDFVNEILAELNGERLSAYPEVNEAYEIISKYLDMDIDNLLLGHGSDSVLFNIISAFCGEGDTIASIIPTYGMYRVYANMLNCKFVTVEYNKEREISSKNLNELLQCAPKVVIIANPNGVIGTRIEDMEMMNFIKEAKKREILVIIDEAYAEYSKKTMMDYVKEYDNLVVVRSFSKSLGMAGARIGYGVMDKEIRKHAYKMKPVVEVNVLAVSAIKVLFRNKGIRDSQIDNIVKSKIYTTCELRKQGYDVLETETNFILINFGDRETKVIEKLKKEKVELKRLDEKYKGYYRVTVGTIDIMEKFVGYIKEVK
ncbi:histidinol-phosphate transaminase [Vallitalea sediminicola]